MSAAGEAKDDRASRAKPRLEEPVSERGRRLTLDRVIILCVRRRAQRRARRRAIEERPTSGRIAIRQACGGRE